TQSAEVAPRAALNVPPGVQGADRETREVIRVAVRGDRPAVTARRNGSNGEWPLARDTLNKDTAETWAKRSTNSWANSWAAPNVAPGANRQQRKPRDGPKSHPNAEEGDMANVSRRNGKWVGLK
ncbi:hypothetical protein LSAT2_027913, partial [Lamellibrachia satsuma]